MRTTAAAASSQAPTRTVTGSTPEQPASDEVEQPLSDTQQELAALAGVPLFAGLSSASLKLLALTAQRREHAPDDVVYASGDAAAGAHVILSGELEVQGTIAGRDIVEPLKPGAITGDVEVIADVPYAATVQAHTPATTPSA